MSTITQRTKNLLANARLVQRCKEDPKLTRRIPIIVREALGIPYEDLTYLPKRRNAVWKVRKNHMMMDKTRPSKLIIEEGTALVPLRIDEDGTYYIKLSDSREQEDKGRHWIEIRLLTDSNGQMLRSKPTSPVMSHKSSTVVTPIYIGMNERTNSNCSPHV